MIHYCETIIENKYYNELKYMPLSDEDKVEDNKSNNNLYTTRLCINDCTMTKSIPESCVEGSIYGKMMLTFLPLLPHMLTELI